MAGVTAPVVTLLGLPGIFDGSASLSGESGLDAVADRFAVAAASLSGESDLAAAATQVNVASAALSGESDVSASATGVAVATVALSGESGLTAGATLVQLLTAALAAASDLSASGTTVQLGTASLDADTDLTAVGGIIFVGTADLSADTDLTATAHFLIDAGTASLDTGEFQLTADTLPIYRLLDPQVEQGYTTNVLFGRYLMDVGQTILIKDNVVTVMETPLDVEIEDADFAFPGGRNYQLTQAEYDAFVAAGRSDLVEVVP